MQIKKQYESINELSLTFTKWLLHKNACIKQQEGSGKCDSFFDNNDDYNNSSILCFLKVRVISVSSPIPEFLAMLALLHMLPTHTHTQIMT